MFKGKVCVVNLVVPCDSSVVVKPKMVLVPRRRQFSQGDYLPLESSGHDIVSPVVLPQLVPDFLWGQEAGKDKQVMLLSLLLAEPSCYLPEPSCKLVSHFTILTIFWLFDNSLLNISLNHCYLFPSINLVPVGFNQDRQLIPYRPPKLAGTEQAVYPTW